MREKDFKTELPPLTPTETSEIRPRTEHKEAFVVGNASEVFASPEEQEIIMDLLVSVFDAHDWCDAQEQKKDFEKSVVEIATALRKAVERLDGIADAQVREELQTFGAVASLRCITILLPG